MAAPQRFNQHINRTEIQITVAPIKRPKRRKPMLFDRFDNLWFQYPASIGHTKGAIFDMAASTPAICAISAGDNLRMWRPSNFISAASATWPKSNSAPCRWHLSQSKSQHRHFDRDQPVRWVRGLNRPITTAAPRCRLTNSAIR